MINKIEFSAKNLTSKAGLFLWLGQASRNGIFDLMDYDLVFENASTNKNKGNFSYKTTRKLREITFKIFTKLLRKKN